MNKTASLNIRINPRTKAAVELLYASLGLTLAEAISLFFNQSIIDNGLPFAPKASQYTAETIGAMLEAQAIASGEIPATTYASARELFQELEREDEDNTLC